MAVSAATNGIFSCSIRRNARQVGSISIGVNRPEAGLAPAAPGFTTHRIIKPSDLSLDAPCTNTPPPVVGTQRSDDPCHESSFSGRHRIPVGFGIQGNPLRHHRLLTAVLEHAVCAAESGAHTRLFPPSHRNWKLERRDQRVVD